MQVTGLTDIGKVRKINEDSYFISKESIGGVPNLFLVADGLGGHNAGEVASQMAIEAVTAYFQENPAADCRIAGGSVPGCWDYQGFTDPSGEHPDGTPLPAYPATPHGWTAAGGNRPTSRRGRRYHHRPNVVARRPAGHRSGVVVAYGRRGS